MLCKHLMACPRGSLVPQNNDVSTLMDAGSWGTAAIRQNPVLTMRAGRSCVSLPALDVSRGILWLH